MELDYSKPFAAYGRTSKETDDAFSVSSQIEANLQYARNNGMYVPPEYVFREDFTGKAFDRPEYSKIRDLLKQRKINGVIIYATDRLARRVSVGEMYLDEIMDFGAALHNVTWGSAVKNTPEDRLRYNFETTFSSFERDKIIERTTRGRRQKAESGKIPGQGRPPFGYKINAWKFNYDLAENAPYVKEILECYGLDQVGVTTIAPMLNARGIPTPGMIRAQDVERSARLLYEAGMISEDAFNKKMLYVQRMYGTGKWSKTTIHQLLDKVDAYTGDYLIHVKGVPYHVEIPPIISKETAEAVKKMLRVGRNRIARRQNSCSDDFLMARRLTCENDGYAFGARVKGGESKKPRNYKGYYICQCTQMQKRCTNKAIRDDVLDPLAINFLRALLLHPDRLFAWWEEQRKKDETSNERVHEEMEQIQARITETRSKLLRTFDRLTDKLDEFERSFYESQKENLKYVIKEYEEREAELRKELVSTKVNPAIIRTVAEMGEEYKDVLETSNDDIRFWRGIVDDLDLTGIVGTDERGEYVDFILFESKKIRRYLEGQNGNVEFDGIL